MKKQLCLCMIVKNESHVIKNCLESVADFIDYWVISDTGSTDGTQDIIKNFFKERNIPGELDETKWKNFGYNRTVVLKKARNKTKYCLIIDADDKLVGKLEIPKGDFLSFKVHIKHGNLAHYRIHIVKNSLEWEYVGVVHEYINLVGENKNNLPTGVIQNCHIQASTTGNRSKDSKKFEKDIQLLHQGIQDEPDNDRYYFYLAQSYKDNNDPINAIKYYNIRVNMGRWQEEVYYSLFMIAVCKHRLVTEEQNTVEYFEKELLPHYLYAYNYRKSRLEALHCIVHFYRINKMYKEGYSYGLLGYENPYPTDILFIDGEIHTYKFIDEMALCAFYMNNFKLSIELNLRLLKLNLPDNYKKRVRENVNFAIAKYKESE